VLKTVELAIIAERLTAVWHCTHHGRRQSSYTHIIHADIH